MSRLLILSLLVAAIAAIQAPAASAKPFTLVKGGQSETAIVVDQTAATPAMQTVLNDAAAWLADAVRESSGASISISDKPANPSQIIIGRAASYPAVAKAAGLTSTSIDAFCIVPEGSTLFILGNTEVAARHGVARLLHDLGFRYYNPSPSWWHIPKLSDIVIEKTIVDEPDLNGRRVFYNYGRALYEQDGPMNFQRWQDANRLGSAADAHTGHSYDAIVNRNMEAFAKNPEYFALGTDGKRNIKSKKFCFSNPELRDLVLHDRIKAFEEARKSNPYAYMINIDPSDGDGTCHCDNCAAIGSSTDRVFSLANHVAKGLREQHPDAWAGLYAYASHRLPPNIEVEPNVYVQVAMAFNDTELTYDQLIDAWGKRSGAIGIREYWGIEAWDWGLPGRMRVAHVDRIRTQLRDWSKRGLDSVNAESGANWGAQTPGMYVATQLMWNLDADVDAMLDEYYELTFESAAEPMRELQQLMDAKPELNAAGITPLYEKAFEAYSRANNPAVRSRIIDMLSYLHYVLEYSRFAAAKAQDPQGGDIYYTALEPLMNYTWRTRYRGMKHQYGLARRLCNGYPIAHKRYEFFMFDNLEARLQKAPGSPKLADVTKEVMSRTENSALAELEADLSGEKPQRKWPIWKHGEQYTNDEIIALCRQDLKALKESPDTAVKIDPIDEPAVDIPDPQ